MRILKDDGHTKIVSGDMFTSGAKSLVIPVNCVGVMGKGLALLASRRFPMQCEAYFEMCARGDIEPGQCFAASRLVTIPRDEPQLMFAATKNHWRFPSAPEWVAQCALTIVAESLEMDVNDPIAVPALGCGLGGLDWAQVEPVLKSEFDCLPGHFWVFAPA